MTKEPFGTRVSFKSGKELPAELKDSWKISAKTLKAIGKIDQHIRLAAARSSWLYLD